MGRTERGHLVVARLSWVMSFRPPIDVDLQILGLRNLDQRCLRIRGNLRRPSIRLMIVCCAKMSLHKSTHIAWTFRIDLVDSLKQVNRPFKIQSPMRFPSRCGKSGGLVRAWLFENARPTQHMVRNL